MSAYLSLPVSLIHFWYIESVWTFFRFFQSLNASYMQVTSLTLLMRTFFQPLKHEYRKGLVGFSIGMGIVFKTILIVVSLFGLGVLLCIEASILLSYLFLPVLAIVLLFR